MRISIIIPCKKLEGYAVECIDRCLKLDYSDYEVIVLPDEHSSVDFPNVRVIPTGSVTPGTKRNIGVANSTGEICAFIDSDAYPEKDWLRNAIKYFQDQEIVAVGGPGVTPIEDSLMQKASGCILSSFMVGGLSSRYKSKGSKESDDIHSCNFIARKSIFEKVKWNEKYWPGEDTLLCLEIKKLKKKMLEAPDVVVYHHRKPLFLPHLKQISQFGLHRGFFAKKFPETSLRLTYFIPSLLVLFLIFGSIASYFVQSFRVIFLTLVSIYLILAFLAALESKDVKLIFPVWVGTILTHLIYGIYFIVGLTKSELKR
ncbi:MAG: glycosyltransferase [Thermoproteota archaeon]|uniref:glycosyltransferase n=1 Tax=Thermofilum sp. TaxID=1961369 RepID=UPI00315E6065